MISFLFWNLNRKHIVKLVAELLQAIEVDVLILAECLIPPDEILTTINRDKPDYYYAPGYCNKFRIFTRFADQFIKPVHEEDRLTIRHLTLPGRTDILLAISHFPSKYNWSEDSQTLGCTRLAQSIYNAETKIGHSRTVLVGDLNMNPFESGVVSAIGLHAVMSRKVAGRQARVVQSQAYRFFYNPMWGLFGDATPGPPGTYYYSNGEPYTYFWNMFDQVLIRPEILDRFDNRDLVIVDSFGDVSLLSNSGLPNGNLASDHLPVAFKLRL